MDSPPLLFKETYYALLWLWFATEINDLTSNVCCMKKWWRPLLATVGSYEQLNPRVMDVVTRPFLKLLLKAAVMSPVSKRVRGGWIYYDYFLAILPCWRVHHHKKLKYCHLFVVSPTVEDCLKSSCLFAKRWCSVFCMIFFYIYVEIVAKDWFSIICLLIVF